MKGRGMKRVGEEERERRSRGKKGKEETEEGKG